jgi:protein-S-isoprenylcysteine O-methyltransferase Ste14
MNLTAASLVAFLIAVGAIAVLALRHSLFAPSAAGLVVQLAAVLLMLWARLTLGWRSYHATANPTQGGLVTRGPYRFVRHPIYAAIIYFLIVSAVTHVSPSTLLLVLIAMAGTAVRIGAEERLLIKQYPEYREYAARTKRVVPFLL